MKYKVLAVCLVATVLTLPAFAHCGACGSGESHSHASKATAGDIVGVASSAGSFNTLVAAVKAAGLVETLKGKGPFTVFAPTDDAFANLPEGLVDQLLLPANQAKLQELLLYHVVAGQILSGDLRWFQFTETLQGQYLWIRKFWGIVGAHKSGRALQITAIEDMERKGS